MIFHLAIPVHDLAAAEHFYVQVLGCRPARHYPDRVTLDFFGHQLVCHLHAEPVTVDPDPYPRHFGMTFDHEHDFNSLVERLATQQIALLQAPAVRFAGMPEEHRTVFLADPSGNVLEFKYYQDPRMMY